MSKLIYESVVSISNAIRDKKISSFEIVKACLDRIESVNPKLNAVVQINADKALSEAKKRDDELAGGQIRGSLHGVPMTIKDNLDTVDFVTTGGTKGRKDFVPERDATVVARLRAEGAVLLGKTNTPELTLAFETDNLIYGRTNNPYDLSRTSGGSSGGAAAIIAAGGVPFDIGSDTGGSIRLPSHFCGITGIRPTSGRVPRTGHILPPGGVMDALTQIGPMARYVEDLALILPIIAGVDWHDPAIVPMVMGSFNDVNLKGLRVAYYTDNGIMSPTTEIKSAVESAAKALNDAEVDVAEACPSGIEQTLELFMGLILGDGGAGIQMLLQLYGTDEPHPWLEGMIAQAAESSMTTAEYCGLLFKLDLFRSQMLSFMESWDVIICPVNALPATPHGVLSEQLPSVSHTCTYNLTGWPAAVVRVGETAEGLPIGVQVVARPWREDVALKVSRFLENQFGGWVKPTI